MTDELTAAAIVADPMNAVSETAMEAAIVRALQQARQAPPGHIIDEQGVVRRVLGALPVTADGCVVIADEFVFHQDSDHRLRITKYDDGYNDHNDKPMTDDCEWVAIRSYYEHDTGYSEFEMYDLRDCYSTREAAEAAKEAK